MSIVDDSKVIPVTIEDVFTVISLFFGEGLAGIASVIDIVEFIMMDWFTLTVIMELDEGVGSIDVDDVEMSDVDDDVVGKTV